MVKFLRSWRREQIDKIQAELKRLHSIEDFINKADTSRNERNCEVSCTNSGSPNISATEKMTSCKKQSKTNVSKKRSSSSSLSSKSRKKR